MNYVDLITYERDKLGCIILEKSDFIQGLGMWWQIKHKDIEVKQSVVILDSTWQPFKTCDCFIGMFDSPSNTANSYKINIQLCHAM